ncbi:MAG: hypothetical protein DPW09_46015 [Anaerolineae bacterium]|nr:hypothetical protein [Anaerolineae bacterium]
MVANVDVATVYHKLLPPSLATPQRLARLTRIEPSCSGFILLLGVAGTNPQLAHHNIFFSGDYRREFDDIFRRGVPPADPTIYVAITSKSDPAVKTGLSWSMHPPWTAGLIGPFRPALTATMSWPAWPILGWTSAAAFKPNRC